MENGTPTGFSVDLLEAITKEVGDEIVASDINQVPWNEALETVRNTPDTVLFSTVRTPEREDQFRWVGPFISHDIVLYAVRSNPVTINSTGDLASYTIGAVTNDAAIQKLTDIGISSDVIITDPDPVVLFGKLRDGEVDLVASGDVAGEYFLDKMNERPGFYKIVYRLDSTPLYFAFNNKTSTEVVEEFEQAFENINNPGQNGEGSIYDSIISSWFPSAGLSRMSFNTEDYYPYNYEKDGKVQGISVDILKDVFSLLNADMDENTIILGPWDEGYNRVLNGVGTAIFSIARTEKREDLFTWAGPLVTDKTVIFYYSPGNETLQNPCDLTGLRIGAVNDDIGAADLVEAGYSDIFYAQDIPTLVAKAEDGDIDGLAYAYLPGIDLIARYAKNKDAFIPACTLETHEFYYAFTSSTPARLVKSFQDALDQVRNEKDKDGVSRYERILYRYLSPSYADSVITPKEVQELVDYTAQALSRDAEGTLKDINEGKEPFWNSTRPDLYVFVYDPDVNMVADSENPSMVGANYHNKTDVTGNPFRDHIVQGALLNGSGWEDYIYSSPAETGLFWKTTAYRFVKGSDGNTYIVCSGLYKTGKDREG